MFKVGDLVVRRREYQDGGWPHADKILIIESIKSDGAIIFSDNSGWDPNYFDIALTPKKVTIGELV